MKHAEFMCYGTCAYRSSPEMIRHPWMSAKEKRICGILNNIGGN